jgi:hypothetical protein
MATTKECSYVALKTQSPVMKRCFDQAIGVISFPNKGVAPESVRNVGVFIAECLKDISYNEDTFIFVGVYGSSLYGTVPYIADILYRKQFAALDQARGDAMLCIWQRNI